MHSRIFGIMPYEDWKAMKDKPVIDYYDEPPHFVDYTDDDTDLNEDFDWLSESLQRNGCDSYVTIDKTNLTIKFKKGFKQAYFKNRFDEFVKAVLAPEMFDNFCGEGKVDMYRIKKLIELDYEFYAADEYGGYETMDSFLRRVDYDTEYKVFQSIDYHF